MGSLQGALRAEGASEKPVHLCPNCAACVVAATWSECVSEICVRKVWSCEACGCEFEMSAYFSVNRRKTEAIIA